MFFSLDDGSFLEIMDWALFSVSVFNITHNVTPLVVNLALSLHAFAGTNAPFLLWVFRQHVLDEAEE